MQSKLRRRALVASLATAALVPLVASVESAGATPTELFFSEYVEGSSNNKALEIYNGTGSAVDLAAGNYSVQMCFNGSAACALTINLTGVVAPGDVFVLAQSSASPTILAQADQTNGSGWFNGDDAVVLLKGAFVVDSIGQRGFDPGTEWGTGLTSTADNTLRRKFAVESGDTNTLDVFDPAVEWNGFVTDDFSGLGFHSGDEPPSVTSTTPANGASGVAVDANVSVTFSESVAPSGSWYTISCGTSGAHAATASGGPQTFTLDPSTDFAANESCTVTIAGSLVSDTDAVDPPDAMSADYSFTFQTVAPATLIRAIQDSGHISPLNGELVSSVPGIVTAKLSNGFYLQDPNPDADDATSEAIFVFTATAPGAVGVGDSVTVSGRVSEFRPGGSSSTSLTTTEITSSTTTVLSSGNPLPAPTVIGSGGRVPPSEVIEDDATGSVETSGLFDPASDGIDFYESLEAMRVQVNDPVAVGPTNGFGEIPVLGDDGANAGVRTARGGVVIRPGDFNPERIILDDTILSTPTANVGDHFSGPAVGVVDYSFGNVKLFVTQSLEAVNGEIAREVTAGAGPKEIAIATFNVENLDPGDGPAKFNRLADLIVDNLKSPDVVALEEVQDNNGPVNDGTTDAGVTLDTLAAAIEAAGGPAYEWRQINPVDGQNGGEPGGNIRQAFLFRTDRGVEFVDHPGGTPTTGTAVIETPSGPQLTFSPGLIDPGNSAFTSSRKPLAGQFKIRNRDFIVVANHFNSKGGDQPLFGRFQPPTLSSESQRNQQAQVVNDFVDDLLEIDPNANAVVLGDFNDFEFSTPIETLEGGVLNDMIETLPQNERYSYVFEGNSQTLDHILVSDHLRNATSFAFDVVHVNAEFADQASDHDPSVVRFRLNNPPRADAGGPYGVGEGDGVTLAASGDDPDGDLLAFAWDLDGNGTYETAGQSPAFSALGLDGPASRTIFVRVTDEDGAFDVATATVSVGNVAPTVSSAFRPFAVACGTGNGTLNVTVADPGPDTFSAVVDWGDGSAPEALGAVGSSFSPVHTYGAAGLYEAAVSVLDDDAGMDMSAGSLRVNYRVTVLRPLGDRPPDVFEARSTIPVKIDVADCDGSHPADLESQIRVVKTSGSPPNTAINEPVSTSAADTTGVMRLAGEHYVYNLAGRSLPDSSATYRIEITLPNGQVATTAFGLRP